MRFGDLRGLPAVHLQLLVPVVFRCRADLLSVLDCCRGVSCYGNRMFLVSISLELELFGSRPGPLDGCGAGRGGRVAAKGYWT